MSNSAADSNCAGWQVIDVDDCIGCSTALRFWSALAIGVTGSYSNSLTYFSLSQGVVSTCANCSIGAIGKPGVGNIAQAIDISEVV